MRINLVGAFIRNAPFGTEIAFKKGFDRLGEHLVNVIDDSQPGQVWDYDADATVVFKTMQGYWHDLAVTRGKKIVYQPDDLRFPHIKQMMQEMRRFCDFAFTFDNDGAELAKSYGYRKAERLLLTADDTLYRPLPDVEKDIDVSFVGSLSYGGNHKSRVHMCKVVAALPGVKCHFQSDLYDIEQLNRIYNRSKIVLNHATDVGQEFGHGYGYQCRHFEAGFTKSCVLSNVIDNERELENVETFASEAELQGKIRYLLANPDMIRYRATGLYLELKAGHLPEHRALQMVKFIESL
ncbi:MAG: glycosyltransferase [Acidobacteriaceae bacterium]|nr:glycosyltransferase [Acidobacteriaceae bacterium]